MANLLLDTNAAIARINGNTDILKILESAATIAIPIIVVGELLYGAENSGRVVENRKQVENFTLGRTILLCDLETARWYARIAQKLKTKGHPIPHNDMWIAALGLQYSLTLLTKDSDFNAVDGLTALGW